MISRLNSRLRRVLPALILGIIAVLSLVDVVDDYAEGENFTHLTIEIIIAIIAIVWSIYLLIDWINAKQELLVVRNSLAVKDEETQKWRQEYVKLLKGVANAIDEQFTHWGLTPAEKDVALLLLKGLSFKEISDIRKTSEKTTRQQATVIYHKSNLPGRAELSAFFLEDFLVESKNLREP